MRFLAAAVLLFVLAGCGAPAGPPVPMDEAGFTEHVAQLLRARQGLPPAVVKGPLTVGVGSLTGALDRTYAICRQAAAQCAGAVDRYVEGLTEAVRNAGKPPTREAVRLVVRSDAYVQSFRQAGIALQPRPLVPGLVILPALDLPWTIRMLSEEDNRKLGLSADEVSALGLANTERNLKPLAEVARPVSPGQFGTIVGDAYDSSRVIRHEAWAEVAARQNGVLVVAVPTTDGVIYGAEASPVAVDALRALTRRIAGGSPSPLSGAVLRWTPGGWEVVP
jgi:uncharacterized protein YtpQ (UPF0354 family)